MKFLFVFILILVTTSVFGADDRFTNRIEGSAISVGTSFDLFDDKFFDMNTNVLWPTQYTNYKVANKVTLGLNRDVLQMNTFSAGTVNLKITYQTWNGTGFTPTIVNQNLVVSNNLTPLSTIDDLSSFIFSGAHKISVEITGLSAGLTVGDLFIESEINVERYYAFDGLAVLGSNHSIVGTNNDYIDFNWNTKTGAEFYELEWVHINEYSIVAGQYIQPNDLNYNFYLNSTRVTVKTNQYTIPNIFDRGYLVFRVRAIGMHGSTFSNRKEGAWTLAERGSLGTLSPNQMKHIVTEYDPGMNWSHQVGYAEDGKRMESVSFVDGLGRGRQTVVHNTETKQAVVSNVYYDELGRPAISDLPTPVDGEQLKHYADFNKSNAAGNPSFNWTNFDVPNQTDPCNIQTQGFSTTSGAGQYYSPNNPNRFDENANIPDAEGYPFSRVTYLNDFTGRVDKVSGTGDDLKIGAGHETQMIYLSSDQTELNKLFGMEAGNSTHYNKTATVDVNGQAYVQYTDLAGRVVASYMAGNAPDGLLPIDGNGGTIQTHPLLVNGANQTLNALGEIPSTSISKDIFIDSDGNYKFSYAFSPEQYQVACMGTVCFDCVYDLELKIADECDVIWTHTEIINGGTLDAICNGTAPYTFKDSVANPYKELFLTTGKYNVSKKLSVNQQAIADYWCFYIENNTCLSPVSSVFNELYTTEEFLECTDGIDDEEDNETEISCDDYKSVMLEDMHPNGQYARYTKSPILGYICADPASVFYTGSSPILSGKWYNVNYVNANNQAITIDLGAGSVSPASLTIDQFIEHFDPSWANSLFNLHPEKCYYDFCVTNATSTSNTYNESIIAEYTNSGALSNGFYKPISGFSSNSAAFSYIKDGGFTINTSAAHLDPFFMNNGLGSGYTQALFDKMNHYTDFSVSDGVNGSLMALSIWQYAVLLSSNCGFINNGSTPTTNEVQQCLYNATYKGSCVFDLIWTNYRALYLELKSEFEYKAQQDYAVANGCSNACIGASVPCSAPYNVLAQKASRFGNISQFSADQTNSATFQADFTAQITAGCQTTCENYAQDWIEKLKECDFVAHNVNVTNLKNSLISLCMSGCNQNHPTGSSTSPTGTTIDDVLAQYGLTKSTLCTELMIDEPEPYRPVASMMESMSIPLDQCACNEIQQANSDFYTLSASNSLPVGVTNIELMLAYTTGVSMEDINHLICVCNQLNGDPATAINNGWSYSSSQNLIQNDYEVPAELTCEEVSKTGCLNCETIQTDLTNLVAEFPGMTLAALQADQNYDVILTNYMNNTHFFTLNYSDYANFIGGCSATPTNPYCAVNPLANEWSNVMKLITYRGELITSSSSPIDLLVNNIIYKHGDLKNTFTGNTYWSSVSGNNLSLHFGTSSSNCLMTLTKASNYNFTDIVSFGYISPSTSNCANNNTFQVEIQYMDCGVLTTGMLTGTNNCFEMNQCVCGDEQQILCNEAPNTDNSICYQPRLDELYQIALTAYEQQLIDVYQDYTDTYNAKCAEAFTTENLEVTGSFNTYQYTLYYYDQQGNLIKTIAPEGIDLGYVPATIPAAQTTKPVHTYKTEYVYNSYGQLVQTTNPDQIGATKFWYDFFGRTVASQNPVQAAENKYTYSLYDPFGRPVEVGQVVNGLLTEAIVKYKDAVPGTTFKNWVMSGSRSEITKTHYDKPFSTTIAAKFANGIQENVRLRVASVFYYENGIDATYTSAIHYSYDIHGYVKEQLQDVPMMAVVAQDVKSTQYDYELISGNVKKVNYQKGKADYMGHSYNYDEFSRLTEVYTSTNDVHKTREAHYRYYDYGPMARKEIGDYNVQGIDMAYTINDWLKGVNSSTLDVSRDMGKDGAWTSSATAPYLPTNPAVHSEFAKDVVAYTLGYFNDDYKGIGATNPGAVNMEASYAGTTFGQAASNLYNGNIRSIVTSIQGMATMGTANKYDQMNRLKEVQSYFNGAFAGNDWTAGTASTDYLNTYIYDKNGNMTHLKRNGIASIGLLMDDFTYNYKGLDGLPNASSSQKSNRLDFVNDQGANDAANAGDIKAGMTTENYTYDAIGELISDVAEGIQSIEWRRGDKKVKKILRSNANSSQVEFIYNPFGERIIKIEKPRSGGVLSAASAWKYSYYTYDANEQVMAIYDVTMSSTVNKADLEERNIYGAGRLGIDKTPVVLYNNGVIAFTPPTTVQNTVGNKQYEISNHLGNVNAVITDRKMISALGASSNFEAVVIMSSDYYPFGMEMPGRHTSSADYRFGYNGMEKDPEVKGNGNSYTTEFRQYDPRLGRWLSLDPLMKKYPSFSPYNFCFNNPILFTDKGGDDPILTATIEGLNAFGMEAATQLVVNLLVKKLGVTKSVSSIDWGECLIEGSIAYGCSIFVPGAGVALKIAKMKQTPCGRIALKISEEFLKSVTAEVMKGNVPGPEKLTELFFEATVNVFVEKGFDDVAEKIMKNYKISTADLNAKARRKIAENKRNLAKKKLEAAQKRLEEKIKKDLEDQARVVANRLAAIKHAQEIAYEAKKAQIEQDKANKIKEANSGENHISGEISNDYTGKVVTYDKHGRPSGYDEYENGKKITHHFEPITCPTF